MTSLLARVALAAALTLASVVGLVSLSGFIIFADVKVPKPVQVIQSQAGGGGDAQPMTFTRPRQ